MMDGRWWWMTNLLGLLTLTAAVFTWLGWWLRLLQARKKEGRPTGNDAKLLAAQEAATTLETRLHEAEGALRRSDAELAEARLLLNNREKSQETETLRARLREVEARLAAGAVGLSDGEHLAEKAFPRVRQELLPLAVSLNLSADELRRVEIERDVLRAELDLLKRNLDQAAPFRSGERQADNLTMIRGVGRVLEERLNAFGVFTFEQIASWSADDVAVFGRLMGFGDRVRREDWQGQCRQLMAEKTASGS